MYDMIGKMTAAQAGRDELISILLGCRHGLWCSARRWRPEPPDVFPGCALLEPGKRSASHE